jgi:hypothetical protein
MNAEAVKCAKNKQMNYIIAVKFLEKKILIRKKNMIKNA